MEKTPRPKYLSEDLLFTSDTHAFHKSILKFCPNSRFGKDEQEMTELMIKKWNETVAPDQIVYHLGDVSFGGSDKTSQYLKRLNGKIHLILGNHDSENQMRKTGRFETIQHYAEIIVQGVPWILCHYPLFEWNMMHHGSVHLYGHVHGRKMEMPEGRSMDVGIDTRTDMGLYTLREIKSFLMSKPVRNHHDKRGQEVHVL